MSKEVIAPETIHAATGYSHAIKAGNTIYVAGQIGLDRDGYLVGKGDVAAQCGQAFENMRAVLESAGASMEDVVKITVYTTHYSFRPKIVEVRRRFFEQMPASTFVVVTSLADPDLLVEIEAIAVLAGE